MIQNIFLLLGSNVGDRHAHLRAARRLIDLKAGQELFHSEEYETAPWGKTDQAAFLNQALQIETDLSPLDLLHALKGIEKEVGRTETERWGPRVIDIDILFYGSDIVDLPELKVPHPYLPQRRFALEPLSELAPDFVHPALHLTVKELLDHCGG
ncbi:MAG: 2-amino-4-hydroxy-6-hydroxymethyldihydropteridine diphosphokinase [Bacteroidetes bacterium]|nr:2-amino-4-hydroxy-6-hydroxymethyldihydropteridine diphosphokinase [Bacteroidota bacterium]